ncbi:MAG: LPXTG cell wall anchor domain-containing protein, partial [Actinomycetota bacterium]
DGSLDTTFDGETGNNGNGKITTTVGTASSGCAANAIAVQSDGKIVAAGYNYNDFGTEDFVVFRYNATSRGLLSPTTTSSTTSSTTTTTTTTTTIATVASTTTTTAPTTPTITTIGTRSTTTIATPTTTATTIFSSPPSRATIAALPLASRPLVTETSLVPGLALTVTYGGFTPGEFVQLVVASTPQVIGSGYANEKGVVTVTGSLPIDLSADKHTLVVFAPLSKKGFRQPITVGPTILPTTGSTNQTHNLQIAMYLIIVGIGLLFARRRSATSFDQTL